MFIIHFKTRGMKQTLLELRICNRHSSHVLLYFDYSDDSSCGPPDWRKFDAVAKVIATCPSNIESLEEYYQKISPQVHVHYE